MARIAAAVAVVVALAATAAGTARSGRPASTFVRSCGTSVYGDLGPAHRWQRQSVVVGPFAFAWIRGARTAARANLVHAYRTGQGAYKSLAVLLPGRVATVSVPPNERRHVALLYDPAAFDRTQTVAHGEHAVSFRACGRPAGARSQDWGAATQFNGGIIVDSPRCVRLAIRVKGGPRRTIAVPFGPVSCR